MQIETAITLYAHRNHHLSHRVRIVMAEKNLVYKTLFLDHADDTIHADLADLNPYNSTPTLVDRELVLYENRVIIDYLEERYKGVKMLPDNPPERATIRQLAWRLEKDWLRLATQLLTHTDSICSNQQTLARSELTSSLITMSPLFSAKAYFMSDSFGLCDCMLAPMLWRLEEMQIELPGHLCKPLLNYCDRVFERPAFKKTI